MLDHIPFTSMMVNEILAIAESIKCQRDDAESRGHAGMDAFRLSMRAAVQSRTEQEAAAQVIIDARAAVTEDSDDDTAPPNGFDEILNEVCEEAGYESEETGRLRRETAGSSCFKGSEVFRKIPIYSRFDEGCGQLSEQIFDHDHGSGRLDRKGRPSKMITKCLLLLSLMPYQVRCYTGITIYPKSTLEPKFEGCRLRSGRGFQINPRVRSRRKLDLKLSGDLDFERIDYYHENEIPSLDSSRNSLGRVEELGIFPLGLVLNPGTMARNLQIRSLARTDAIFSHNRNPGASQHI